MKKMTRKEALRKCAEHYADHYADAAVCDVLPLTQGFEAGYRLAMKHARAVMREALIIHQPYTTEYRSKQLEAVESFLQPLR